MRPLPSPLLSPWAISDDGMRLVLGVWSRGELFADVVSRAQADAGSMPGPERRLAVRDGVAVIPIVGPLFRHASLLTEVSGATSYERIGADLEAALAAPDVRAIMLDVDSPGGEANGVMELASRIRAASAVKPVEAYVGGMGASAAYWLASAASRVTVADSAWLGSIGVRSAVVDDSAAEASRGERTIEIVSSQSPAKRSTPVDDTVIARRQSEVDALAALFVEQVAAHRGVSEERVLSGFGRGGLVLGRDAVARGMADALGHMDTAVAHARTARGGFTMTSEEQQDLEAAARFRAAALEKLGAASQEEALGVLSAAMASHAEVSDLRRRAQEAETALSRQGLRLAIEGGLAERRLSLGACRTMIPDLVAAIDGERGAAMRAALATLPENLQAGRTEQAAVVDAIASVDVSPAALRAIQACVRAAAPVAAAPVAEPSRNAQDDSSAIDEVEQRIAAQADRVRRTFAPRPAPQVK